MALQRQGAPRGILMLAFDGSDYSERYRATGTGRNRSQWVDLNTPEFRRWFETIAAWRERPEDERDRLPPLSIHDLPDNRLITPRDLARGVYLTANVWLGSNETRVEARIDGGQAVAMNPAQAGRGEAANTGAAFADPFAAKRQLSVARHAIRSRHGHARARGYESFRAVTNRGAPQPQGAVTDRSVHLWRLRLPENLEAGVHVAEITSRDRHDRSETSRLVFEVREQRPPRWWQHGRW